MKKRTLELLFDLQVFSEDGNGAEEGDGGGQEEGKEDEGGKLTFDDFLGQEGNQAEFDRRVQRAINTAVSNAQKKWQTMTDDRLSEAEKLAKMSKEEKAKYLQDKERREFEEEKAAFEREKLTVAVTKELQGVSLPTEFAESLVGIGDAKKIKEAIEGIKKVWDAQISEAIKGKARQGTPKDGGYVPHGTSEETSMAEMARNARIIK